MMVSTLTVMFDQFACQFLDIHASISDRKQKSQLSVYVPSSFACSETPGQSNHSP